MQNSHALKLLSLLAVAYKCPINRIVQVLTYDGSACELFDLRAEWRRYLSANLPLINNALRYPQGVPKCSQAALLFDRFIYSGHAISIF